MTIQPGATLFLDNADGLRREPGDAEGGSVATGVLRSSWCVWRRVEGGSKYRCPVLIKGLTVFTWPGIGRNNLQTRAAIGDSHPSRIQTC